MGTANAVAPSGDPGLVLNVFARTDVGITRKSNLDGFLISDLSGAPPVMTMDAATRMTVKGRGVLLAVSDGAADHEAGEVASALVLSALVSHLVRGPTSGAENALRTAVQQTNVRLHTAAQTAGRASKGATLTAMLFQGDAAHVAEVGGSRAYLLRNERLLLLTGDQSRVQDTADSASSTPVPTGAPDATGAATQAVGVAPTVAIAMTEVALRPGDRYLLCSDGLSDLVPDGAIARILLAASSVQSACDALVMVAIERGGTDNVTAVVADFCPSGGRLPRPAH